jgi:hypothetical protein
MSSLLILKSLDGAIDADTDHQSSEWDKSNRGQMLFPTSKDLVSELIPVAKASVNALLIHVASRGSASAFNPWRNQPRQAKST